MCYFRRNCFIFKVKVLEEVRLSENSFSRCFLFCAKSMNSLRTLSGQDLFEHH